MDIELLVMDVDGVLTDGGIIINDDGSESKRFHVHDGAWLRIWQRLGLKTAIISGRHCQAVVVRAEQLEIDYVYLNEHFKGPALERLAEESQVPLERMAYIGDDVMDLPVMRRVGFAAAVANALEEVRQAADFVTTRPGGSGAVQELVAHLIGRMGRMDEAMERYR